MRNRFILTVNGFMALAVVIAFFLLTLWLFSSILK